MKHVAFGLQVSWVGVAGLYDYNGPPTPVEITGTAVGVERSVTGRVLKFVPRKRRPIMPTGTLDTIVTVPVTSPGTAKTPGNICVRNCAD
jgi:hypothetical protein